MVTGQAKPRAVCGARYSDNDLRINTYTPWATTVLSLQVTPTTPYHTIPYMPYHHYLV